MGLLVLALLYVGARRPEHLRYLADDPLVGRFCGLARVPTARTVGNWLRRFTQETLRPLVHLNQDLVLDALAHLEIPRLTLDVDGTVVRTGATVAWAFRGFNPHHRKDRQVRAAHHVASGDWPTVIGPTFVMNLPPGRCAHRRPP